MPKRKQKKNAIRKLDPTESHFILSGTTQVQASSWDSFFGEIRVIFLKGLFGVNRRDIEIARKRHIEEYLRKYFGDVKREEIKISGTERLSAEELMRELGFQDDIRIFQIRRLDSILWWLGDLVSRRAFNLGDARAIKELLSDMTGYCIAREKRLRDEYVRVTKGRPKKYISERKLLDAKMEELKTAGKSHTPFEVLKAVEEERGRKFPVTMRTRLLEAWTTEKRRQLVMMRKK